MIVSDIASEGGFIENGLPLVILEKNDGYHEKMNEKVFIERISLMDEQWTYKR